MPLYLGVKALGPMHYGTFPALAGAPAVFKKAAQGITVHELIPGKPAAL